MVVAVSNAVTMAVAVVMAEPLDLMDVMAAGASLGVPALAAGDRDAPLGRKAAVEAAAASPATGRRALGRWFIAPWLRPLAAAVNVAEAEAEAVVVAVVLALAVTVQKLS